MQIYSDGKYMFKLVYNNSTLVYNFYMIKLIEVQIFEKKDPATLFL